MGARASRAAVYILNEDVGVLNEGVGVLEDVLGVSGS
jgi:hypothetical protein